MKSTPLLFGEVRLQAPRDCDLLKRRLQPLRQLRRIVIGPEVNEEEAWLLVQHMAVDCRDLDAIFA